MNRPWWLRVDGVPPAILRRRQAAAGRPLTTRQVRFWRVLLFVTYPLAIVWSAWAYPLPFALPIVAFALLTVSGLPTAHLRQITGRPVPVDESPSGRPISTASRSTPSARR